MHCTHVSFTACRPREVGGDAASIAHGRLSTVGGGVFSSWSRLPGLATHEEDDAKDYESQKDDTTNNTTSDGSGVGLLVGSGTTADGSGGTRSTRGAAGARCCHTRCRRSCRFDA